MNPEPDLDLSPAPQHHAASSSSSSSAPYFPSSPSSPASSSSPFSAGIPGKRTSFRMSLSDGPGQSESKGFFSVMTESIRRSTIPTKTRSSAGSNRNSAAGTKETTSSPPQQLFAGFDLTSNDPLKDVPEKTEEDDLHNGQDTKLKFIWPEELRHRDPSFGDFNDSYNGNYYDPSSLTHRKSSTKNWKTFFNKETELQYNLYFLPVNRAYWSRIYLHCFAIISTLGVFYAIVARVVEHPVSLIQSVDCREVGYIPCFGEQGISYGITAVMCLLAYAFSRTSLYQHKHVASHFHTGFLYILVVATMVAIFFRSSYEVLGLQLLLALSVYGSACQPVWALTVIGTSIISLSILAFIFRELQYHSSFIAVIQACDFDTCWFPFIVSIVLTVMAHITGVYYSAQAETFSKKEFVRNQEVLDKYKKLKETKMISDRIALSILPRPVWEDLRLEKHQMFQGGFHQSLMYHHDNVTIFFADIVGFTKFSSSVPAETLVWLLNAIFLDFDNLVEKESLEKIKTIGDCYVLCAGVPKETPDHAYKVVKIGLEMVKRTTSIDTDGQGVFSLPIRVGVHSGSVVAGLIGDDKLIYDVWGQDVNIASMMEKTSQPCRVHVSEATFLLLGGACTFEPGPYVTMENPTFATNTYFINSLTEKDEVIPRPKKKLAALTLSTKSAAQLEVQPSDQRLSANKIFNRDSGEEEANFPESPRKSSDRENPASLKSRFSEDKSTKELKESPSGMIIRKPTTDAENTAKEEQDNLEMYVNAALHIHPTFLVFRDPELELEYQLNFVKKMGGKFLVAVAIIALCTGVQAILTIYITYSAPSLVFMLVNLTCLLPVLLISSFKFWRWAPMPRGFSAFLSRVHSKLTYQQYQLLAMFSIVIMFMNSFWGLISVYIQQQRGLVLSPELALVTFTTIQGTMLTSITNGAVFTRLNSFVIMLVIALMSLLVEGMTFLFTPSINVMLHGEPFLLTIACVYGLFIVQQRLDTFVRRNYLMKKVLIQNNFEIQDIEEKSKRFLRNLLPASVVQTLKADPDKIIAQSIPTAAVLFCCISNFETFDLPSMRILNEIVSKFDHLCVNHGVEKIKLIGNTYMAATGVSGDDDQYLSKLADFALALNEKIVEINKLFNKQFVIRIGLETGPLVAGVIGKQKFAFDIWGLTVNVASRMESTGVPGKVQVTGNVCTLLKDRYLFEKRGEVEVKGRGLMETYFLKTKRRGSQSANILLNPPIAEEGAEKNIY